MSNVNGILAKLLKDQPQSATYVAELLEQIGNPVTNTVNTVAATNAVLNGPISTKPVFVIFHQGKELVLYERRGKTGFQVSRKVYDKAVEYIVNHPEFYIDDIFKSVCKSRVSDANNLRALLRFWKKAGIISNGNSPYYAVDNFVQAANKAWDDLRFGPTA
jgi:hypothetical protein